MGDRGFLIAEAEAPESCVTAGIDPELAKAGETPHRQWLGCLPLGSGAND